MNTSEIRNEARKLAKFPFVEPALVDELIDRVDFYRVPGTATMICSIILKSGFTVVDHASCKDPRNFNEEPSQKREIRSLRLKRMRMSQEGRSKPRFQTLFKDPHA